jgi:hypothetical protein
MDPAPEVIRHQIDQTRSSLTEKLETLECQVRDTVSGAKVTVEETIQNVKSTVHETMASVKRTFDLKYQVERHPWAMFGGSVLAGFLMGKYGTARSSAAEGLQGPSRLPRDGAPREEVPVPFHAAERSTAQTAPSPRSAISRLVHQFDDEIEQVKEIAIGAAVGVLQDLARDALPQFRQEIDEIMQSATRKLGGKPMPRRSRESASLSAGR